MSLSHVQGHSVLPYPTVKCHSSYSCVAFDKISNDSASRVCSVIAELLVECSTETCSLIFLFFLG